MFLIWRRRLRKFNPGILIIIIILFLIYYEGFFTWFADRNKTNNYPLPSVLEVQELGALQRQIRHLTSVLKKHGVSEEEYADVLLPPIYIITPTYARPLQKAELTRLKSVFLHISSLHWIVVEDASSKSDLVQDFLQNSGLTYTHLHKPTPKEWKLKQNDPQWRKPRGVLQRNEGIRWLHESISVKSASGVIYFADDDNTYSTELFDEMRWTQRVSVWPVGLVGGVMVERPQVIQGRVTGWLTGWRPDRPFATDMAGFAVNLGLVLQNPNAIFSHESQRGFLESDFLGKLVKLHDLEPKARFCKKVYVWHTRTETPKLKDEERLKKEGRRTDKDIEV